MTNNYDYTKHCSNVLLVEGNDDYHVIKVLSNKNEIPESFFIKNCGCKTQDKEGGMIVAAIEPTILSPSHKIVGIVVDADKGPYDNSEEAFNNRWKQINTILTKLEYNIPSLPAFEGTIIQQIEDKPKVGIWMMPDNKVSGMLEDFINELANEKAIKFSTECVEKAKKMGEEIATFKDVHKSKAIIHTYLAWQDKPGMFMGQAINAGRLKYDVKIANLFIA